MLSTRQVRICFNRKNKSLGALFRPRSVVSLLAANLRTHRAIAAAGGAGASGHGGADSGASSSAGAGAAAAGAAACTGGFGGAWEAMDLDDGAAEDDDEIDVGKGGKGSAEHAEVRAIIDDVLERTGGKDRRAAKLEQDDYMALLAAFNEAGIHFSNR